MKWLLLTTALLIPTAAQADPLTALFVSVGIGATAAAAITQFIVATALSALANAVFGPKAQKQTPQELGRVNTRFPNATRWQAAGLVPLGGEAGTFGEYDEAGNFWYIVTHADQPITGIPTYLLDGIEVELSDGTGGFTTGDVLTDDFCLTTAYEPYEGSGTRLPIFRLYTVSPAAGAAYGTLPAAFTTAFSSLPADFRLAGVSFTIVRCLALAPEHYGKAYHWRGPFALGEPSVICVGNFARMYDPRNGAHNIAVPSTWTAGDGNPAIIWAWWQINPYGRNRAHTEIDWALVTTAANACDVTVLDRSAVSIPKYRCGFALPDNAPRAEGDAQILASCDGFEAVGTTGLSYPVIGVYAAPTLTFTAERDIMSAATIVVDNGDAQVDGVVARYTSPDHGWTVQESAPWLNTLYYDGTSEGRFAVIDVPAVQNHNQAVRMAKATGLRIAPARKAVLQTTVKGVLAFGQRAITLDYDAQFDGVYEIATPIEEDPSGMACAFAVVPLASDRWSMGVGEEGVPPQPSPALSIDGSLAAATGVVLSAVSVQTESGRAVRLEATFTAPSRVDRFYRFRYAPTTTAVYQYMITDMGGLKAIGAIADDGVVYDVSWETRTAGGRSSGWSTAVQVTATANPTAPPVLTASSAAGGVGQASVAFTTANSVNQARVKVWRNTTTTFGTATLVTTIIIGPNQTGGYTNTGLAAGTYYFWNQPANGSGVAGTQSGPHTAIVT